MIVPGTPGLPREDGIGESPMKLQSNATKPSPSNLLMAAATMSQLGKFHTKAPPKAQILKAK